MKLLVQSGKKQPFHPTIKIDPYSGICANQWSLQFFRPGLFIGGGCPGSGNTIAEVVAHYFAELKRTGHHIFQDVRYYDDLVSE